MIGIIEKSLHLDDYNLEAVFTPTIVNLLILDFVFTCAILPIAKDTIWWQTALAIVTSIAAAVVLTRFTMQLFRGVSRTIFEDTLYRKDRLCFPTTSMLLLNDKTNISQMMKKRVRDDLKSLYNIRLLTKTQEEADEMEARRTAKDAVGFIRRNVADSKDVMTHRKLKRYGMFRNFLGGAVFCLPLSFVCWLFDYYRTGVYNSIILSALVLYLLIVIVDFFIAKSAAEDYAETLINTFDNLNHNEAQY